MAAVFDLIPVLIIIIIIAHVPKCSLNPYQPNLAYYSIILYPFVLSLLLLL